MYPDELKYSENHEWARAEGDLIVVGITDYAQEEIQDVVYVELPEIGATIKQEDEFGTVESVKAANGLFSPVSGEIAEINEALEDAPELVNQSPYDAGWMIKIRMNNPGELDNLLSADQYRALVEGETAG